jgi:far upstream element-binding protein
MQIMVPDRTVGLIIGRGGETIRDLQERSGCHVNIVGEQKSVNGLRPVNLIGSREAAARAKDLIMEIVESDSKGTTSKDRTSAQRDQARDTGYGSGHGGGGGLDKVNDSIFVPSEAVGMIIGKGGETIKDMQSTTGCKINVSPSSGPGEIEREIGLVGSRDAIAAAKRAIEDKVEAVVSRLCHFCKQCIDLLAATEERRWWGRPWPCSPKRLWRSGLLSLILLSTSRASAVPGCSSNWTR